MSSVTATPDRQTGELEYIRNEMGDDGLLNLPQPAGLLERLSDTAIQLGLTGGVLGLIAFVGIIIFNMLGMV